MHSVRRMFVLGTVSLLVPLSVWAQDPRTTGAAPPTVSSSQKQDGSTDSTSKKKSKHSDDFLIRGTIFTPEGLSFPGAEIRIRRSDEKKYRWQTESNSRGEFAIRVKQGRDYEVVVHAKECKDQTKAVNAKSAGNLEELTIRMEREGGKKQ